MPAACNYERCVFVGPLFAGREILLRRLRIITLIKKGRLTRFKRFKDQNTRRDSVYPVHISEYFGGDCHLKGRSSPV